jgi:hypothetical protein
MNTYCIDKNAYAMARMNLVATAMTTHMTGGHKVVFKINEMCLYQLLASPFCTLRCFRDLPVTTNCLHRPPHTEYIPAAALLAGQVALRTASVVLQVQN